MARIYLEIAQFSPPTQQTLQRLRNELPDPLNVDNGLMEGAYRAWVSYPDGYGENKARTTVKDTLAKMDVTGLGIED
jgi:hypothetical protein